MSDMTMREAVSVHYRGIDLLRDENAALRAEIDRLRRILAALREPSENVSKAVWSTWCLWDSQNHFAATLHALVRAAVAAAEQEVGP